MRNAEYSDVEEAVYAWFLQQRERHVPISEEIILQKAREFFTDMNYGEGVNFEASVGWFQGFKHRVQQGHSERGPYVTDRRPAPSATATPASATSAESANGQQTRPGSAHACAAHS
nr:unnamed protein product [Callosobruchus analis]